MLVIKEYASELDHCIDHFRDDIATLRTGRVNASLVENIIVEAYQSKLPIMQLASISTPEPRVIVIQPWDKAVIASIEQALQKSNLNLQPVVDKDVVRLNFPSLTEEKRAELVKLLKQKSELAKVAIKQKREKIREKIMEQEKSKAISEDEKFSGFEALDEMVKQYHEKIKLIAEQKEQDIMTI